MDEHYIDSDGRRWKAAEPIVRKSGKYDGLTSDELDAAWHRDGITPTFEQKIEFWAKRADERLKEFGDKGALRYALMSGEWAFHRTKGLEKRIEELESRQEKTLADAFQGPWMPHRTYKRGALTQYNGSAWIALTDTEAKPGEGEGWRMLVRGTR